MALQHCTEEDLRIIGECLNAVVSGPFIPEWEFSALFGLERSEVAEIMSRWPSVDEADLRSDVAVNNSLGNLVGYPHGEEEHWDQYISVPPERVLEVLRRWRLKRSTDP